MTTIPQDPNADAELKQKLKANAIRRWAGNILHSRSSKVRVIARAQCASYGWETELASALEQQEIAAAAASQDPSDVEINVQEPVSQPIGMQIDEISASPPIDSSC